MGETAISNMRLRSSKCSPLMKTRREEYVMNFKQCWPHVANI